MKSTLTKEEKLQLSELLAIQWNNDPGMIKHCMTQSYYIHLGEGVFLDVGSKQTIHNDMWYDDETKGPEVTYEDFEAYNKKSSPEHYKLSRTGSYGAMELTMQPQYIGNKTNGKLLGLTYDAREEYKDCTRTVTPDDLARINAEIDKINADYTKRLQAYWKRFSNKVHARGYWANR